MGTTSRFSLAPDLFSTGRGDGWGAQTMPRAGVHCSLKALYVTPNFAPSLVRCAAIFWQSIAVRRLLPCRRLAVSYRVFAVILTRLVSLLLGFQMQSCCRPRRSWPIRAAPQHPPGLVLVAALGSQGWRGYQSCPSGCAVRRICQHLRISQ